MKINSLILALSLSVGSMSDVLIASDLPEGSIQLAQTSSMEELLMFYDEEDILMIATGSAQPIAKAPAVATVITAKDIKATGATEIAEVLEMVPGVHVARNYQSDAPIYTFRGIYTLFNPQVLIMVNGIPINTLFFGNPDTIWGGIPVESISRVEVIRGPGSAIYGADAFAGVVNLITKTADEVNGLEAGLRYGSFATKDAWLSYGGNLGGYDVAFFLEHHSTNGHDQDIEADAQTFFDGVFGTNASHAPGSMDHKRNNLDLRLDLSRGNWQFRGGWRRWRDLGIGTGVARALDPQIKLRSDRRNADLTWHDSEFSDNWDLKAQVSYLDTSAELEKGRVFHIYPPGTTIFGDVTGDGVPDPLPDGMIGTPEHFERHYRADFNAFYGGFKRHNIRLGAGAHYGDLYKIREGKNFGVNPTTGLPALPLVPNSPIFSVTDTPLAFMTEGSRTNYHAYVQDIWNLVDDWELTLGLRYDEYSDYGHTYNPRAALVWSADYNLTIKMLHGEAFRSPSWAETRAQNNPAAVGNPDLGPETIKTTELVFDYHPTDQLHLDLSLFHYDWENIIEFLPDPAIPSQVIAQNAGRQRGYGLEFVADWKPNDDLRLRGNYAWQRSTDEDIDRDAGNAPRHQVYLQADWVFMPNWHLNGQVNWVGERRRVNGDPRDPLDDYVTVDLTLRRSDIQKNWEAALLVNNLFDEDVREPSMNTAPAPFLPDDIPGAGRSILAEFRYHF